MKPSKIGNLIIKRFISIEAWVSVFTCIIYSIIRMARGLNFQK